MQGWSKRVNLTRTSGRVPHSSLPELRNERIRKDSDYQKSAFYVRLPRSPCIFLPRIRRTDWNFSECKFPPLPAPKPHDGGTESRRPGHRATGRGGEYSACLSLETVLVPGIYCLHWTTMAVDSIVTRAEVTTESGSPFLLTSPSKLHSHF